MSATRACLALGAMLFLGSSAMAQVAPSMLTVHPNHVGSNGDVQVDNNTDSQGDATIKPGNAGEDPTHSTVSLKSGFKGSVTGVDGGQDDSDTVTCGSNVTAGIQASGGTVNIQQGGCHVTVENISSSNSVTVNLAGGQQSTIPPGNTATYDT